mgnify:CR=1 FL=1
MRTRIKVTVVNGVVRKVNTMKTLFGEARGVLVRTAVPMQTESVKVLNKTKVREYRQHVRELAELAFEKDPMLYQRLFGQKYNSLSL